MKKSYGKAAKRIAGILAMVCLMAGLAGCHVYDGETKEYGDFTLKFNSGKDYAMVYSWNWDGDPDNTVIEIPDKYEGKVKIDALGGPLGTNAPMGSFQIETDCDLKFKGTDPEKYKDVEVSFDEVVFTLEIGENISKIHMNHNDRDDFQPNWVPIEQEDGSVIFYRVYFEVECDDDNKTFYSEDGVLYQKKDNVKVGGILYREEDD